MSYVSRNILLRSLSGFLLVLMLLIITNKSIYIHTHHLADGTIVVHAHPFNKSGNSNPDNPHKHSKSQFEIIQHFDGPVVFPAFTYATFIKEISHKYFIITSRDIVPVFNGSVHGRSPPKA